MDASIFFRCLIFLCAGFVTLMVDLVWFVWTALFVLFAAPATGKVVDHHDNWKHPVVVFTTAEGEEVRTDAGVGMSWVEVGQEVPLLYNPSQPLHPHVATFDSLWLPPLLVGGFGLLPIVGSILVLWSERRNVRTR